MKPATIGELAGRGMRHVRPTPGELAAAEGAAASAAAELGIAVPRVRFYASKDDGLGRVLDTQDRTVWVRAGLPASEIGPTVRHEVAHLAQRAARRPVGHGRHNTRDDWRESLPERFAQGDRKAARKLRWRVRYATTRIVIHLEGGNQP